MELSRRALLTGSLGMAGMTMLPVAVPAQTPRRGGVVTVSANDGCITGTTTVTFFLDATQGDCSVNCGDWMGNPVSGPPGPTIVYPSDQTRIPRNLYRTLFQWRTGGFADFCSNDFESVVFGRHPQLSAIKKKLVTAGAGPALMTGSGAALFGVFESVDALRRAQRSLGDTKVVPVSFVSGSRYRAMWRRQLAEHVEGNTWPPQSRYSR